MAEVAIQWQQQEQQRQKWQYSGGSSSDCSRVSSEGGGRDNEVYY